MKWAQTVCKIVLALFLAGIFLYTVRSEHEQKSFNDEQTYPMNSGWVYTTAGGLSGQTDLPVKLPSAAEEVLVFSKTLPEGLPVPTVISFRTAHQRVRVTLNGEEIYAFGQEESPRAFGKTGSSAWNLVRLPADCVGQELSIFIQSPYQSVAGSMNEVRVGSKAATVFYILEQNLPALLLSLVMALIGLALVMTYLVMPRRRSKMRMLLYLGLMSLLAALWVFGESRTVQFFADNLVLSLALTFFAMLAIPVVVVKYLFCLGQMTYGWVLRPLCVFFYFNLLATFALQALGVVDLMEMLPYIHMSLIAGGVLLLVLLVLDLVRHHNRGLRPLAVSVLLLCSFAAAELMRFYLLPGRKTGTVMTLGVLAFILSQLYFALRHTQELLRLSREAERYAFLATRDALTHCGNRRAYEQRLAELTDPGEVCVVLADINDLKGINDSLGHEAGDDAIIRCAECFCGVFGAHGDCYRIGGDEFIFLGRGISHMVCELIEQFYRACAAAGEETQYPLCVACGWAVYCPDTDGALSDTVHRADLAMYEEKIDMKGCAR